jgi:hypothetical protein
LGGAGIHLSGTLDHFIQRVVLDLQDVGASLAGGQQVVNGGALREALSLFERIGQRRHCPNPLLQIRQGGTVRGNFQAALDFSQRLHQLILVEALVVE